MPDIDEARRFYQQFGLDVRAKDAALELFTKGHPHRWAVITQEEAPKRLRYLSFGIFEDEVEAFRAHLDAQGVRQLTMATYAARMFRKTVDREEAKDYWIDRYERLLRACVRNHDVLPPDRTIDVYFHEWTRDPDPILRAIYAMAEIPLTPEALAALHAYSQEHGEQGRPRIMYDLEGDFGITADEVRERFGFYFDRFPVAREVR